MKECFKCHEVKPLDQFYKHPQMKDGRVNKCKECNKADVSLNYRERIEHYKSYEAARNKEPHRKIAARRHMIRFRKENPEKYKAHSIVSNARRSGLLLKEPCEVCKSEENIHAHHDDYSKPLKVRWLCAFHHVELHSQQLVDNPQ